MSQTKIGVFNDDNDDEAMAPDEKDIAYLATALKLQIPMWSNDKALKEKQNKVAIYTTEELIKHTED